VAAQQSNGEAASCRRHISPPRPRSVAIADDSLLLIESIARALDANPDVVIAARATSGDDLLAYVSRRRADVVLLDPWMEGLDGLAVISFLAEQPGVTVIALSSVSQPERVDQAIAAGAAGCIMKDTSPSDLASLVGRVAAGVLVRPRRATATTSAHALTAREREVLALVAEGLSNLDVANRLFVTEQTVKFHLGNVYRKLGVTNRTAASRWAATAGLIL
jgi:DNA-binding NarL/FixJ family response regulator